MPVAVAERFVTDSYASITISDATYQDLAAQVDATFDTRMAGREQEIVGPMANRAKLESESDKLLAAHLADAIDLPTLKRQQDRIRADLTDDEQLRPHLAEPFTTIIREAHERGSDDGKGRNTNTPLLRISHIRVRRLGWTFSGKFSNKRSALKFLIRRLLKRSERRVSRGRNLGRHGERGPVAKNPTKPQTRLTADQRAELVADYESGVPVRTIASKDGVHRGTIPSMVRNAGGKLRKAGLSEDAKQQASALYGLGRILTQIAKIWGQ